MSWVNFKITDKSLVENRIELEKELTTMPEYRLIINNSIKNIEKIMKERRLLILLLFSIGYLFYYDVPEFITNIRSIFNFR